MFTFELPGKSISIGYQGVEEAGCPSSCTCLETQGSMSVGPVNRQSNPSAGACNTASLQSKPLTSNVFAFR